jgi:ribosomal protein S18 acetylase RimI-like enzyme
MTSLIFLLSYLPATRYNQKSGNVKDVCMEIIKAQEKHVPEILVLWEEFARHHEPFDPRYPMRDGVLTGYESYMRHEMENKDSRVMVALDDNRVIGYMMAMIREYPPVWRRERYGFIDEMAVTAAFRRRGAATKLLEEALEWFKAEKIDMVELTVAAKNNIGYSFWKKHGFRDYIHHLYLEI